MDKTIRALGISVIVTLLINIIYIVLFFGNVFNNTIQIDGKTMYFINKSELESFLGFETIILSISILLTILLVEHEVTFIETLKRIIRIDEIEER